MWSRHRKRGNQASEDLVTQDVTWSVDFLGDVLARSIHHVIGAGGEELQQVRGRVGVVSAVAVNDDVDVSIDVGEHSADDVGLSLHRLARHDRASSSWEPGSAVDVNCCRRQKHALMAMPYGRRAQSSQLWLLVETGDKDCDVKMVDTKSGLISNLFCFDLCCIGFHTHRILQ